MLAIVEAYKSGLLNKKNWASNIVAGLIVGVVALPLAMAFAIASGAEPAQGLYTAIIAAVCVGLFGGSRVQIAGPTGAFIVILAGITAHYGIAGLQLASLMAGFILLLMGILKFGNVIKFIPDPVIVGFTSGIGVIIFVGEWKDFFGLPVHLPIDAHFYQKITTLTESLPHLNIATMGIGLLSLFLVIATPKLLKRLPGPLVAMVIPTALQMIFHFHVATLGSTFGSIPQHLPPFHIPAFNMSEVQALIIPAFTIALLGSIESLLSAAAADGMANTRHNSNQELIGQGIANIFSPLFGGFAATGAIARTSTNIRNGGNSPIAAVIHSGLLILILLLLSPLTAYTPLCALAAILFVVAYNMSDIPHFIHILKHAPIYDSFILLTTFLLTVFTNLVIAVNVGVLLAMIFFIRNMHHSVSLSDQTVDHAEKELSIDGINKLPKDTLVYTIQGPFFFGVAEKMEHALSAIEGDPKAIVFRLKDVPFIDVTGLQTFQECIKRLQKRGIDVYLSEANDTVRKKLENVGVQNFAPQIITL